MRDYKPRDKYKNKRGFGGHNDRRGGQGRRDDHRSEMFDAVCDECGNDCQLPFRPTENKPVFCSRCFEQQSGGSSKGGGGKGNDIQKLKEQIDEMNEKLDIMMETLASFTVIDPDSMDELLDEVLPQEVENEEKVVKKAVKKSKVKPKAKSKKTETNTKAKAKTKPKANSKKVTKKATSKTKATEEKKPAKKKE